MLSMTIACILVFLQTQTNDVVTIKINNYTDSGELIALYGVYPSENHISKNLLTQPIPDNSSALLEIPQMVYPALIGVTSSGLSYRFLSFTATDSATVTFDRMRREFGTLLNKIYGSNKLTITNASNLHLTSISITDSTGYPGEVLFPDVIFPEELVYVWLDSEDYNVSVTDNSNTTIDYSISIDSTTTPQIILTSKEFIQESTSLFRIGQGDHITNIVSALTIDSLVALELYNLQGELDTCYQLEPALSCWDKLSVQTDQPISWLSMIDSNGRSYSLSTPDSVLGVFIIHLDCVDFDFEFDYDANRR